MCQPGALRYHTTAASLHGEEVHACQSSTVIADNDAIGVQHGHNLKDKFLAQPLRALGGASQIVYTSFHHP